YIVLAHALEKEILFLTSPDLKEWTLQSAFGKGEGAQDGVWECPDLFPLTIDGKKKWVLIVNLNPGGIFGGSATQYFIGDFDGKKFTADTDASGKVPTKWMDYGKDHYATVTWSDAPDGRRTAIGWMSNWQYAADVPTTQFRSANTLPRELSLFRAPDGEIYLASVPSPETDALIDKTIVKGKTLNVGKKPSSINIPSANDGICRVSFDIESRKDAEVFITLSNSKDEKVVITYKPEDNTISFDRTKAGISDFSRDFPAVTVSPTFTTNGRTSVNMFIDRSSIEMFAKDGRYAMTNLVFPNEPYSRLSFSSDGSAKISNLDIYSIKAE
ncbi:MAG: GH32 C-terminal domain-containing protein, partial [Muribaculaceae bacterium]|nr:GH32 C-terminal domain-containing protein [Muribaculaceae bacterium]